MKIFFSFMMAFYMGLSLIWAAEPPDQDQDQDQIRATQPRVGRDAAAKYFEKNSNSQESGGRSYSGKSESMHYLSLGYSHYAASQSYQWSRWGQENGVARNGVDLTYQAGDWRRFMDLSLRISYNEYSLGGEDSSKLSLMPLITFPESRSRFPLYFGAGLGLGVFLTQVNSKSPLSLDYQVVVGSRFMEIFENTGFFIEAGLKNHLLLTSSGQLNGTFLAGGLVFTF